LAGYPQPDGCLLLLYLGLKHIGFVGLADVGQLKRGLNRVSRQLDEILPDLDEPLCREDPIERCPDVVQNAQALNLTACLELICLQLCHTPRCPEFAA